MSVPAFHMPACILFTVTARPQNMPMSNLVVQCGQVIELDLYHPVYHAATLRHLRLYVNIIKGVDLVASVSLRDSDNDGLRPPVWQLERAGKLLNKVAFLSRAATQ